MATLIRIGNSQGVRIPKAIIEQAKLENRELEFRIIEDGLLIKPIKRPREGWKDQFDQAIPSETANQEEQAWLDAPLVEDEDWEW